MTARMPVEAYRELVLSAVDAPAPARMPLRSAYGCVLAADLCAPRDLPPFPSSAMDGYAVRSADVAGASPEAPAVLRVAGEVPMGRPAPEALTAGRALAIPTGGMMPAGADAVIPHELCRRQGDRLLVDSPPAAGANVRPPGEDIHRGEVLVPKGRRLGAADLGALAAGGWSEVDAFPPVRVAVLSTGDELVDPGVEPAPGQIHESNSFMLEGLIRQAGAIPQYAGRVNDDPEALLRALAAAPGAGAFVCSGGVSAGVNDPVRRAFAGVDAVGCIQVAVQPGRPQAFGTWLDRPFFGLPGNPMAALVGFELFVRPALNKMMGLNPQPRYLAAVLEGDLPAAPECPRYFPVRLARTGSGVVARATGRRRSNQLGALAQADGLVEVATGHALSSGDSCRVIPLRED